MSEETYDEGLFPDQEDFKAAQDAWGAGLEETEKSNPVGTFQAKIVDAELGRSMSSDRLQIHFTLEIAAGEYKGVELNKYDGLETAQQASITQQGLQRLGVDTTKLGIQQLPAALLGLKDKMCQISCRKNGQYYNIYFQRLMGKDVGGGAGGAARGDSKKSSF